MAVCMDDVVDKSLTEQNYEIVALRSIYEENFRLLQEYENERANQTEFIVDLHVHHPYQTVTVEAVIPVQVDEPINQPNAGSDVSDNQHGDSIEENSNGNEDGSSPQNSKKPGLSRSLSTKHWHIKSEVKELNPIHLRCRFSSLYPAQQVPPEFHISCDWLNSIQIRELSKKLEQIWQENAGDAVVYRWTHWLQNCSWEFLGLSSHLVLKEGSKHEADTNVPTTEVELEMALLNIFEYDTETARREFFKVRHTCDICIEEKDGHEFCFLDECHHSCCLECLKLHCEMHIHTGTVTRLLCPIAECDVTIPPQVLRDILEEDLYSRWERLLLSKTLDRMRDIFYCPRCNSAVVADEDESSRLAQCATCFFAFCVECQGPWHYCVSCTGEQHVNENITKKKKKKNHNDDTDEDDDEEEPKQNKRTQTMSSRTFISAMKSKGMYRNCPDCRVVIEKNMGCNYMTCFVCHKNFCWVCGKKISGYGHFSSSPACSAYSAIAPVLVVVAPPSEGDLLLEAYKENNPGKKVRTKKCPTCSQKNIKDMNNNHLSCWSCKTKYCYLCGKNITRGIQHFVLPNMCTQHSED